jgi:hypothetical protein
MRPLVHCLPRFEDRRHPGHRLGQLGRLQAPAALTDIPGEPVETVHVAGAQDGRQFGDEGGKRCGHDRGS